MSELREETQVSENARSHEKGQPQIGALLRKRREERGWDIEEIAVHLKIRPAYLTALEEDAYERFPERAYAVGYLRAYATLLGLDAGGLAVSLSRDTLAQRAAQMPQLSFPTVPTERRFPLSLLLLLGAGVIAGAYGVWYHYTSHDVPAPIALQQPALGGAPVLPTTPADVPQSSAPPADTLTLTPLSPTTEPLGQTSPKSDTVTGDTATKAVVKPVNGEELDGTTSEQPSPFAPAPATAPVATTSSIPEPAAATAPVADAGQGLKVHALKDSWVQVKDRHGKTVYSQILKGGESWEGTSENAPYTVTAGNAGGVVLQSGAVTSAPLGQAGRVRRNVSVTPQEVQTGKFGHSEPASDIPELDKKSEAQ